MAVVRTYQLPGGGVVRIHDDDFAPDQPAAWAHARAVQERIHWEIARKKLAEEAAKAAKAEQVTQ